MPHTRELNKLKKINHTLKKNSSKSFDKGKKQAVSEIKSLSFFKKLEFLFHVFENSDKNYIILSKRQYPVYFLYVVFNPAIFLS